MSRSSSGFTFRRGECALPNRDSRSSALVRRIEKMPVGLFARSHGGSFRGARIEAGEGARGLRSGLLDEGLLRAPPLSPFSHPSGRGPFPPRGLGGAEAGAAERARGPPRPP